MSPAAQPGEETDAAAAADERVHQLDDPARAGRRLWVPVDERAAERVDVVRVDPELAGEPHVVDGERVVRLDHGDVGDPDARVARAPSRAAGTGAFGIAPCSTRAKPGGADPRDRPVGSRPARSQRRVPTTIPAQPSAGWVCVP